VKWRTVIKLVSIDVKASRAVKSKRFRRFRESRKLTFALYTAACILGLLAGWLFGNFYCGLKDEALRKLVSEGAANLFITLPTIALIYGLVFTQMSQIQRTGAKIAVQPLYWFPITWEEHTIASVMANIVGTPLIITAFICPFIILASIFLGLTSLAALTLLALMASLFAASITTEVFKTLQVRIYGAVTKAAGRAAIWVRLIGSIIFFIIFYTIYFSLYYNVSPLALIESVSTGQKLFWFIPYLWPGVMLSAFSRGMWLETLMFLAASAGFIFLLFKAAVKLNMRFGLYEAPSIKVSKGFQAPSLGLLGRLGYSTLEAAIIRKDLKAFTRRHELIYIFMIPIIIFIMPLLSTIRGGSALPSAFSSFFFIYITLFPCSFMAASLGSIIFGSEGGGVWLLCSSPLSAKSLIKAKYSVTLFFSLIVAFICALAAGFLTAFSLRSAIIGLFEAVFLSASLSMVSLVSGVKGADFREIPRPRMVKPLWSLINLALCFASSLAVLAPLFPYALALIFQSYFGWSTTMLNQYLFLALIISGAISAALTYAAYRIAINSAEQLLSKAEI
jgi:hypothetical protein